MLYVDSIGNEFKVDLWCTRYNKNCEDVPENDECIKCCYACADSE